MPQCRLSERTPSALTVTTSPGRISRTNAASTASKAQLSEAKTTVPSARRPMQRGRKPCLSLAAMSFAGEAITRL